MLSFSVVVNTEVSARVQPVPDLLDNSYIPFSKASEIYKPLNWPKVCKIPRPWPYVQYSVRSMSSLLCCCLIISKSGLVYSVAPFAMIILCCLVCFILLEAIFPERNPSRSYQLWILLFKLTHFFRNHYWKIISKLKVCLNMITFPAFFKSFKFELSFLQLFWWHVKAPEIRI